MVDAHPDERFRLFVHILQQRWTISTKDSESYWTEFQTNSSFKLWKKSAQASLLMIKGPILIIKRILRTGPRLMRPFAMTFFIPQNCRPAKGLRSVPFAISSAKESKKESGFVDAQHGIRGEIFFRILNNEWWPFTPTQSQRGLLSKFKSGPCKCRRPKYL